jgi:hypothetical protein
MSILFVRGNLAWNLSGAAFSAIFPSIGNSNKKIDNLEVELMTSKEEGLTIVVV